MGKITGFIEIHRKKPPARPIPERIRDWREVYLPYPEAARIVVVGDQAPSYDVARYTSFAAWSEAVPYIFLNVTKSAERSRLCP